MAYNINTSSMLKVGTILHGVYRIERYLSSGGFGNTYVATNVEFDEVVAIKEFFIKGVTHRDANNTTVSVSNDENSALFEEQLQKFKKEARRLRKLKNPHIIPVHDLFEENGTAYYVMDYVDGENLSEKLKRLQQPLSEKEVLGYLTQVLDALDFVHQKGIWHLDLKPANIMVDKHGNVSLIDFGASKQRSHTGGATTSSAVSYTNGYAPREQMEQMMEKFGPWTDLYALGATLYNLLANKRPPMPSDLDDDHSPDKHLALSLPADVSANTRQLILRLMTTDRLYRPQSVAEVRKMMLDGSGVETAQLASPVVVEETLTIDNTTSNKTSTVKDKPQVRKSEPTPEPTPEPRQEMGAVVPRTPQWKKYGMMAGIVLASLVLAIFLFSKRGTSESSVDTLDKIAGKAQGVMNTVSGLSYQNAIGTYTYKGEVDENNVPNGKGEATFDNGKYYKGPFVKGNLSGENCLFVYQNGNSFKGSFKNNQFDEGTYTLKDTGEYFKGSFKDGKPAHGTWYDKSGNVLETL